MMGFSVIFIFALLQICTLCDGGNSEDLSNISDSSNHRHHLRRRQLFNRRSDKKKEDGSANKEEDQSMFYFQHLKFVASKDPPEGAAQVSLNKGDHYIIFNGNCNDVRVKALKSSETIPGGFLFIVNKDNFEILEWRTWADIQRLSIHYIGVCNNKHVIVKDNNGISSMTVDSLKESSEVFTLNYDIKGQDFQIDNCEEEKKVKADKIEVIKRVTADNKNCEKAKHVVKFDQGNDISRSFLKSRTHAVGGAVEASVSGNVGVAQIGGKVSAKYDYTRLNSETTSNLDKDLHSVSMEIEVPPNHSCTIEIKRKTTTVEALCSGQIFRQYKNGEKRTTSVTGIYNQEEVTEILTSMNPCKPVTDGAKC